MKLPDIAPRDGDASSLLIPLTQEENAIFDISNYETVTVPKTKRSFRRVWIALAIVAGILLAAYIGFSIFFMSHFTFNTTINGIDVAMQSADDVDALLATEMSNYSMQLEGREDQGGVITGDQINLTYLADDQMDGILANQLAWAWPLSLLPHYSSNIQHVNVEFDEQKLKSALSELDIMDKEQMNAPVDASLSFEDNAYVISGGNRGTTLDIEKTEAAVADAIDAGETTLDLDEAGLYVDPTITEDDPTLVADRDRFNQYVPFKISYTFGDRTEVLDGYTTINWVETYEDGSTGLNSDAVSSWVAELASKYDTVGSTRTIVNGFGEEKTVSGGTYGWQIDQEAEYWAIMDAAAQRLGETREPYLLGSAVSLDAQDWGTTYLEVDLTSQHMWYFVDGVCVLETDVVTGNPNTGYATPQGVYYIFSKSLDVVTRGDLLPDGTYEWEVPVTYWMPFTYSGCGFHDAYWQPSFGGDAYLYRGSHGCINMPSELAKQLYDMVEPGTPVITHF